MLAFILKIGLLEKNTEPQEVKDIDMSTTPARFTRVLHDLVVEEILTTRSFIRLDISAWAIAMTIVAASNTNALIKQKKINFDIMDLNATLLKPSFQH